jgi:NAD(P)H-flavin reductase
MELIPKPVIIKKIITESKDVKSFSLEFEDESKMNSLPGQFVEATIQGIGESTFAISRLNQDQKSFEISVKKIGHLTKMLHRMSEGEIIGIRGPYGRSFPIEEWKGKNIFLIGGGIGLAPLRPIIDYLMNNRKDFGHIDIIFGARTPEDILYKTDLENWQNAEDTTVVKTIDIPAEGWTGTVGFVPSVVKDMGLKPDNRIAITCGPPIMIKYTIEALKEQKWLPENIYTTLEMKMQCGIGQCGRCNLGSMMICKDGPVFNLKQISGYEII